MTNKLYVKALALILAIPVAAVMPAVTTMAAEDLTPALNGAIVATDGNSHEYTGDVTATAVNEGSGTITNSTAVLASGENTSITVNGDVTITRDNSIAEPVAVMTAGQHASVHVTGDVTSDSIALYADGNQGDSSITVDGNVTSTVNNYAVKAKGNTVVEIGGDVSVAPNYVAISAEDTSNVNVNGKVNGNVMVSTPANFTAEDVNGGIRVVLTAPNADGSTGVINVENVTRPFYFDLSHAVDRDNIGAAVPHITLYSITSEISNAHSFDDDEAYSDTATKVVTAFVNNTRYRVKTSNNVAIISGITSTDGTVSYNQAITVSVPSGYTLKENGRIRFREVSDGVYEVALVSRKGGMNIETMIKEISNASGVSAENVIAVVEETPTVEETRNNYGAPTGSIVITNTTGASVAAPVVEGAKAPSKTVKLDIFNISPIQYKSAVIDSIATTVPGSMLRIESSHVSVFDAKMIEAIASNPTIDVEVLFTYNGKKMRVVIPAGYDVNSLLDENGYCGYLRLAHLLGSQVIE